MKFWEAMKELQEGKKIKLIKWEKHLFIRAEDGVIYDQNDYYFYSLDEIMLEDGWEIFE